MKVVISIVALALAGTSSSVRAHELRGGAVVLTGAASDILPQVLSDVTTTGVNKSSCLNNKTYYNNNKAACRAKGWYYNNNNNDNKNGSVSCSKCEDNESYWQNNKRDCQNKGCYYNRSDRQNDIHDEQCEKWKKNNYQKYEDNCKNALAAFFANYEDADLIFDILTNVYDDEEIQDQDPKDDVEETQDE